MKARIRAQGSGIRVLFGAVALCAAIVSSGATPAQTSTGDMGSMGKAAPAKPSAPLSTGLVVTVDGKATKFTVPELQALPQTTVKVHNAHTNTDETYMGVALGDVLAKAGFAVGQATHQTMLRSYLKIEGTDKYWVLYSVTEVEGSEHAGDVIVATSMDGKGLGADGAFKLVSTEDKKPQRWVRNLTAIALKTAE
jgi:hypothetical protein